MCVAHRNLSPCSQEWRELLGSDYSPFMFPSPRNPQVHFVDYKAAWHTAAKKAGLSNRRIYDLRSTFASRANSCRATGITVAQLLGHANTQILPTYVRPFDENTRAVISAMDAARNFAQARPKFSSIRRNLPAHARTCAWSSLIRLRVHAFDILPHTRTV